jgi:hypothetical protein
MFTPRCHIFIYISGPKKEVAARLIAGDSGKDARHSAAARHALASPSLVAASARTAAHEPCASSLSCWRARGRQGGGGGVQERHPTTSQYKRKPKSHARQPAESAPSRALARSLARTHTCTRAHGTHGCRRKQRTCRAVSASASRIATTVWCTHMHGKSMNGKSEGMTCLDV